MTERIFISYAYQDRKYLDKVLNELRKHGIVREEEDFLDPTIETASGYTIREEIKTSIEAASKVVILWTEGSAKSQWVNYEAGMAEALGKSIIVVIPEGSEADIPFNLADVQVLKMEKDG